MPTIYDAPELLASMALDGEFTLRGAGNALFNPSRLSPAERETVATRIKSAAGNTSVGNALIDVAMNPWTWLFFITSPAGTSALAESASGLTRVASKYLHAVKDQPGVMRSLGLLTGNLVTDPNVSEVLHWAGDRYRDLSADGYKAIGDLRAIDYASVLDKAERARRAENAALVFAKVDGLDRAKTVRTPSIDDGKVAWESVDVAAKVDPKVLDAELQSRGLSPIVDRVRSFQNSRLREVWGVDGAADFVPDDKKILNVWRGLRNPVFTGKEPGAGIQAVREILSDDILAKVGSPELTYTQFQDLVKDAFTGSLQSSYMPRNTFANLGVDSAMTPSGRRAGMGLGATFASVPRDVAAARAIFDPAGLEALERAMGGRGLTPAFADAKAQAQKVAEEATAGQKTVRAIALDPASAIRRYNADTSRTIAWHVDSPTDAEWQAHREWKGQVVAAGAAEPFDPAVLDRPRKVWSKDFSLLDLEPSLADGVGPVGRANRADLLLTGWAYTAKDASYSRNAIERVLIPAVMGRRSITHSFTASIINHAQQAADFFANSMVGQAIEAQGAYPEKFVSTIRNFADESITDPTTAAGSFLANSAAYMQTAMLGASMSSVLVNATQPFGPAAVLLGTGNVIRGMGKAIGELGGYISERVSTHGLAPITDDARSLLISKHFKYADLADIGPNALEMLDRQLFSGSHGVPGAGKLDTLRSYLLGAFGYAEMVNRSATAHAVEGAFAGAGRAVRTADGSLAPEFQRAARRVVQETQFGSDPMNTPLAFMSNDPELGKLGGVLANPLARQFLPFVVRSATTLTHFGPRFAGRTSRTGAMLNDFARGMAISSVLYEGSKNLFGIDMSPSLYFATTTDLVPGLRSGRYDKNETPFPIPPVVDTLFSAAKGLAEGDRQMIGRSFVRMLPGGVALARAMDVMPPLPGPLSAPQKTYIGWDQPTPDGLVPVYDGASGQLVDAVSPTAAILHGVGADMGWWNARGNATKFLVDNRDEMSKYRRAYIGGLLSGDEGTQKSAAAEFEKRFRMPLKVSQQQMREAMKNRATPRIDRVLRSMPADVRPTYQAIVNPPPVLPGAPAPSSAFQSFSGFGESGPAS